MSATPPPQPPPTPEAELLATISQRLQALGDAAALLALGPERVFTFAEADTLVRLHLPFAPRDDIQRNILRSGTFYEHRLLAEIRPMIAPGAVVVDAGANIGNHSVYFALICGAAAVHAIEPMRVTSDILRRNIALNGLEPRVIVHQMALGAAEGTAELRHFFRGNLGAASVDPAQPGVYRVAPLDSLGLDRVDFVKMDVEGGFVAAIEGAAETLRRCRPPVWIELRARAGEIEPGTAALERLGYARTRAIGGSPNDHLFEAS